MGCCVDLEMVRYITLLLFIGLAFWSCEEEVEEALPNDCAGVEGGSALVDSCGVCDSDSTNDCSEDCAGVFGGTAVTDSCGTCDDDPSNDCTEDCAGVWGGNNICGCTDITAINYDSTATFDDGSCNYQPPYNYFETSYNLKHPDLWLDYYEIPVANGLPLNGVDSEGNTFPFWYDAAVAIADFNGDGFEDILHSKTGSDLVTEEYPLELFINDGSNEIFILDNTLIPDNAKNTTAREAAIGDFNNDGYPDVFYADHGIHGGLGGYPSILLSNSNGYSFSKLENLLNPYFYHSLASGDVNNDGYLDVVIIAGGGENGVLTLLNTGNSNFVLNESFFIQDETYNMWSNTLFDINADGYLELIVTGACFNAGNNECVLIGIYWGNGQYFTDGSFTLVSQGTVWTDFIGDVAIADINGDGKEEIIGRYHDDGVNEKIMIYKHDGDYNYTDVTDTFIENNTNTTGRSMVWIRAQDIDNDGFMDVFNSDKGNSNIGNTQRWEWNGSILERQ